MKFLVVASILIGSLSAATHFTEEEIKVQKQATPAAAAEARISSADQPVQNIHDILGKLTAGLGQAVAQNENIKSTDPLSQLMNLDFLKGDGNGFISDIGANLKKALGDTESFKDFLGAADLRGDEEPLNIGKMFPPKVLDDIFNGKTGGFDEDAHAAVDQELSKILGMEKEKVTDFRTRIFKKFSEKAQAGDLNLDEFFDPEFKASLHREL